MVRFSFLWMKANSCLMCLLCALTKSGIGVGKCCCPWLAVLNCSSFDTGAMWAYPQVLSFHLSPWCCGCHMVSWCVGLVCHPGPPVAASLCMNLGSIGVSLGSEGMLWVAGTDTAEVISGERGWPPGQKWAALLNCTAFCLWSAGQSSLDGDQALRKHLWER